MTTIHDIDFGRLCREHLADVGCGPGAIALTLARRLDRVYLTSLVGGRFIPRCRAFISWETRAS